MERAPRRHRTSRSSSLPINASKFTISEWRGSDLQSKQDGFQKTPAASIRHAGIVSAQTLARLTFEVASVKPTKSQGFRTSGIKGQPGGRLTITNLPLYRIVLAAYHINSVFNTPRLSGGPEWIRSEGFDIEAVPPAGAIPASLSIREQEKRSRVMLQNLLADRFKLAVWQETKEIPAYVLTVSGKGVKLQKSVKTEGAVRQRHRAV